jgi:DNA-binding CsgD family transcriptional regulator
MANRRERGDAVTRREPTKYEEHKLGLARLTRSVRDGLRDGLTIAAVMAKHPGVSKRFVEEQRAFLKQTEGLTDTRRTSTGADVARLTADGLTADQIAQTLGVSVSSVYQHRRKQQTCNYFAK